MSQKSVKYSFHADSMESTILISCPITGIVSQIIMPHLPIALIHNHPLSDSRNALECVKQINKKPNSYKEYNGQMLAGLCLSMLKEKGKLNQFPNSSASEANMMLQSAGIDIIWGLCDVIRSRWESEQTWSRIPKLSFNLQAYEMPDSNFSEIITRYSRLIRKAMSPEELSKTDIGEIYLAFRENNKKLDKKTSTRFDPYNPNAIHVKSMSSVRSELIQENNKSAKVLARQLAKEMPAILAVFSKKVADQIHLFGQQYRTDLAVQIRVAGIGHQKQDDFKQLAFLIENVESSFLDEEIIGFSESVSPTPRSNRKASDIIAERLAMLSNNQSTPKKNGN